MKRFITILVVIMGIVGFSTLHAADLHGIVADKDWKPVIAKVVLKDTKGAQIGKPVTTGKDGSYAFKDIKPGLCIVVIGEKNEWKIFVGPGETRRDFSLK